MRVVVAEKPSVARDLARVLGGGRGHDGYIEGSLDGEPLRITWCIGHLLELEDPEHYDKAWKAWRMDALPMVPERFALRPREGAQDQWQVVKRLLQDRATTEVINACDAGREGELIFRYAYQHAGARAPVRRLWVSSLTDDAIREGWRRLQPAQAYDRLADAARCRSEADWLVGLNATRAMTCRSRAEGGDALWSVGRVQTPTLAMIVRRDDEIARFVPETYWQVKATLGAEAGTWTATWFRDLPAAERRAERPERSEGQEEEADAPHAERLRSAADAEAVVRALAGKAGRVLRSKRAEKRERPPLLYDLTSLQRRANQRFGLSAQQVLDVAQALYERHKLITYPRTDARYLTSDQAGELPRILRGVGQLAVYRPFTDALLQQPLRLGPRIIDDAEVGDHHAILPTGDAVDPTRLTADEKRIYDLVARRLIAALSGDAVFDQAEIVVAVPPAPEAQLPADVPAPLTLRARGRVLREAGWRAVDPPGASKDLELPPVKDGDPVSVREAKAHEGQTRPPRPHDDASLLGAMETAGKDLEDSELKRVMRNAGLGTPATRAAILQTLVQRSYVTREGRALRATEKGKALIGAIPIDELKSAELTGRWEKRLADMADGRGDRETFMRDVVGHVQGIVDALREVVMPEEAKRRTRPESEPLGPCPACGTPVRQRGPVYACETGRSCTFVVFAKMAQRAISPAMVKELLRNGKSKAVKGFRSKAGKEFSAGLTLQEGGKVGFWFPEREEEARGPEEVRPARPAAKPRRAAPPRGERSEDDDGWDPTPPPPEKKRGARRTSGKAAEGAAPRRSRSSEPKTTERAPARSAPAPRPEAPRPAAPRPAAEGDPCPTCGVGRVIRGKVSLGCSRWREGCGWRG